MTISIKLIKFFSFIGTAVLLPTYPVRQTRRRHTGLWYAPPARSAAKKPNCPFCACCLCVVACVQNRRRSFPISHRPNRTPMIVRCPNVPANQAGAHKQNAKAEQAAKCQFIADRRATLFAMHSTCRRFERRTVGAPAAGRSAVQMSAS